MSAQHARSRRSRRSTAKPGPPSLLGLAIARHLVELHGGTVHAASAGEQQGATFIVRLPLLVSRNTEAFIKENAAQLSGDDRETSFATESEPVFIDSSKLDGLRVLIVDDEADAREAGLRRIRNDFRHLAVGDRAIGADVDLGLRLEF